MLDQIISSLSSELGDDLSNNSGLSRDQVNQSLMVAGQSAFDVVSEQMSSGNLATAMNLFSGQANSSEADTMQNMISSRMGSDLMSKLGISQEQVGMIVASALPLLLKQIGNKNDETPASDSSMLTDLFGGSSGLDIKDLGGMLGKFL